MCSVSVEETLLDLNKFQLSAVQGDDIFLYQMVIKSVRPSSA